MLDEFRDRMEAIRARNIRAGRTAYSVDSFEALAEDLIDYAGHLQRSREAWEASARASAKYGAILGEEYLRVVKVAEKAATRPQKPYPKTIWTFGPD
jgi:hypothetical protein